MTKRAFILLSALASLFLLATPSSAAVAMTQATANASQNGILVAWETSSEVHTLGFNIYRGLTARIEEATIINGQRIPSKASDTGHGASYNMLDSTANPGVTYYYWIEDIEAWAPAGFEPDNFCMGITTVGAASWGVPESQSASLGAEEETNAKSAGFSATFKDPDANLSQIYLVIGDSPEIGAGISAKYDVASGLFSLYDARQGGWQPGVKAGEKANMACQYGALRGYGSQAQVSHDGTVVQVVFKIRFWERYQGQHAVYVMAEDASGATTGWQSIGTWEVQ